MTGAEFDAAVPGIILPGPHAGREGEEEDVVNWRDTEMVSTDFPSSPLMLECKKIRIIYHHILYML